MDIFDEIGIAAFYVKHLAGGAINLNAPIALDKDELHHPFIRPNVDAINFRRNTRRDILPGVTDSHLLQLMNGKPVSGLGRASLHRIRENNAATVLFPAKKQASNSNDKEEDEKCRSGGAMYFTGELQEVSLTLPRSINRFVFSAGWFLQQVRLL